MKIYLNVQDGCTFHQVTCVQIDNSLHLVNGRNLCQCNTDGIRTMRGTSGKDSKLLDLATFENGQGNFSVECGSTSESLGLFQNIRVHVELESDPHMRELLKSFQCLRRNIACQSDTRPRCRDQQPLSWRANTLTIARGDDSHRLHEKSFFRIQSNIGNLFHLSFDTSTTLAFTPIGLLVLLLLLEQTKVLPGKN